MEDELYLRELVAPLLNKWAFYIILHLSNRKMYFAELHRNMGAISRKMLAKTLQELIDINLIVKHGESSTGHKTYYSLTELGESLLPVIFQIKTWIKENQQQLSAKHHHH